MKAFLTYSGKGGVGKTTITYSLYRAFKSLGFKTIVLDMDLNTPSMHYLIDDEDLISNHRFMGLFLNKSVVDAFLTKAINIIRSKDPEILLIDTPPSITDIHISLIKKLRINSVVLVSQPTELSKGDIERTVPFFENERVSVMGIIENMVENNGQDYRYEKLLSINKEAGLDSRVVYDKNARAFIGLANKLLKKNPAEVTQENRIRQMFDETITEEAVMAMYAIGGDDSSGYYFDRAGRRGPSLSDIKFVSLKTWPALRNVLTDMEPFGMKYVVSEATPERVERLVNAFKTDDTALVMVTKAPNTEIPIVSGEIGECTLKIDDKFNGIPCVEYHTNKGVVRMFPHEVMPADDKIIQDSLTDGAKYVENGKRLIPSLLTVEEIAFSFGSLAGMPSDKKQIKALWQKCMGLIK